MSSYSVTLCDGNGVEILVTAVEVGGEVQFTVKLISGTADLNGFFIDLGNNGGTVTSEGSKANNMNGSALVCDADGNVISEKMDGFDYAEVLGTVGGSDADVTCETFTISGITSLDQLIGAQVGVRATSVGEDREGSLKLAGILTEDTPPDDDFPEWEQDISNVVLVFDQTAGDTKPVEGKTDGGGQAYPNNPADPQDGDGYYTVKIDNWPTSADDDLDNSIDDILDYLIANDPYITEESELLGVIIKGGQQDTNFYAYGDENTNGTDPDPLPTDLGLTLPEDDPDTPNNEAAGNATPTNAIDQTYQYEDVFATV
jgi:hypothetical protein